jgi:hypothetical protein
VYLEETKFVVLSKDCLLITSPTHCEAQPPPPPPDPCVAFLPVFPMLLYAKRLVSFCLVYPKFPSLLFICPCFLDFALPVPSLPLGPPCRCHAVPKDRYETPPLPSALLSLPLTSSRAGMNSRQICSVYCILPTTVPSAFLHPLKLTLRCARTSGQSPWVQTGAGMQ